MASGNVRHAFVGTGRHDVERSVSRREALLLEAVLEQEIPNLGHRPAIGQPIGPDIRYPVYLHVFQRLDYLDFHPNLQLYGGLGGLRQSKETT